MPARSLNKVLLIGNLTRDPELRYTPAGNAVCSFGLATNRYWATDTGEKREETQFHRLVAWNKLAEICSQILGKGDKVYLEGRLQTRQWIAQDGTSRTTTEIVVNEMILLRSQKGREAEEIPEEISAVEEISPVEEAVTEPVQPSEEAKEIKAESKEPTAGGQVGMVSGKPAKSDKKKKKVKDKDEEKGPKASPKTSEEVDVEDIPF